MTGYFYYPHFRFRDGVSLGLGHIGSYPKSWVSDSPVLCLMTLSIQTFYDFPYVDGIVPSLPSVQMGVQHAAGVTLCLSQA